MLTEDKMEAVYDIDYERSVLSYLLVFPQQINLVMDQLSHEDFFLANHQKIYATLVKLHQEKQPFNLLTVIEDLKAKSLLQEVGGKEFLLDLYQKNHDTGQELENYVNLLKDKSLRRKVVNASKEAINMAQDCSLNIDLLLEKIKLSYEQTSAARPVDNLITVGNYLSQIEESIESLKTKGIPTGVSVLDRLIGGFKPGKLYILAARPAMGKTMLSVFFASYTAKTNKFPVLFLSAEMSLESLAIRFISNISGIDSNLISNNRMSYEERDIYKKSLDKFKSLNLIIDDTPAKQLDNAAIARKIRSVISKFGGISLVIIDYIQLLGDYNVNRRDLTIGEISRFCKDASKVFEVPFLVLAQINRGVETRSDKRPGLSDLKDSGSIEQDSDLVMLIYRDEYYNEFSDSPGETEIIVAKNRDGRVETVSLQHDLATCNYFENRKHGIVKKF